MDSNRNVLMNKYNFGRLLGQGNFAKVYHGRDLKSGQSVAIKVIDKERVLRARLIEQTKREISIMGLVKHQNIVQLYEVMATKTKIYFIMEYVKGGELFHKVAQGKLKESIARKYFVELICAVDVCHSRGVYHRDLKLENLLLDENENLKVSDFGLSALIESKRQDGLLHTTCGTPAYVAPEVMTRKGYDGVKADIWSCGVILFVMLAGSLPFRDSNLIEMYRKVSKADYKCPNWFPSDLRKLLSRILDPNPCTRISISKIRNSSWFKKGSNIKFRGGEVENMKTSPYEDDSIVANETKLEMSKPVNLNAFDLISFSSGLNLSGLFVENEEKDEVQFTSLKPVSVIVSKLEEITRDLNMRFVKKDKGLLRFERLNEDTRVRMSIDVEIFEITPSFHMVELKQSKGDPHEYHKMLKVEIKPALEDIVFTWRGQQQQQQKH